MKKPRLYKITFDTGMKCHIEQSDLRLYLRNYYKKIISITRVKDFRGTK